MTSVNEFVNNEDNKRYFTFFIIYLSFFLDNVLLTVVVPIIPDYLHSNSLRLLADTSSPIFNHQILPSRHHEFHDNISLTSVLQQPRIKRFPQNNINKTKKNEKQKEAIKEERNILDEQKAEEENIIRKKISMDKISNKNIIDFTNNDEFISKRINVISAVEKIKFITVESNEEIRNKGNVQDVKSAENVKDVVPTIWDRWIKDCVNVMSDNVGNSINVNVMHSNQKKIVKKVFAYNERLIKIRDLKGIHSNYNNEITTNNGTQANLRGDYYQKVSKNIVANCKSNLNNGKTKEYYEGVTKPNIREEHKQNTKQVNYLLHVLDKPNNDYIGTDSSLKLLYQNSGDTALEALETEELENENVSVGVLLSLKALVQLVLNPIVGMWTAKVGCRIPILVGSLNLLVASLLFAWGSTFWSLAAARAVQGAGSAALGVAGMCLAADLFTRDAARSRAMGILLGSVALGVLVGYPFGGITYAFSNKSAPFLIIAVCVLLNIVLQLLFMDVTATDNIQTERSHQEAGREWTHWRQWRALLRDRPTTAALVAVFTSTCAMAVLEPCLPIWLMKHFKPEKWQLGTVFVPDSAGYLLATNVFGAGARILGRARVSVVAVALVGFSAFMIPSATSLQALLLPHACLGTALGAADAALVPALTARVAPSRVSRLGALFSLHQTAVSAAYFVAPILGGELTHLLGFAWCLRIVGGVNILCSALLFQTFRKHGLDDQFSSHRLDDDEDSPASASERLAPHAVISYMAMQEVD